MTEQINALAGLAREHEDYTSEQFMQWFIKEQIEEVATMSDLLRVVERARENPLLAEEYLAREQLGDGGRGPDRPAGGRRLALGERRGEQLGDRLRGLRARVEVALDAIAAEAAQALLLLARLDALGDDRQPDRVGHVDRRLDDRAVVRRCTRCPRRTSGRS